MWGSPISKYSTGIDTIFQNFQNNVTSVEQNQYFCKWSNLAGYFKAYLELYTMDLSVTIDEHFIKYNYCLVLCLIFNHFLKTKYTESNGKLMDLTLIYK